MCDSHQDALQLREEQWRKIPGYESCYEVSDMGRIRSIPRYVTYKTGGKRFYPSRIRKTQISQPDGYPVVNLLSNSDRKTFKVHRLVLEVFSGECPEGMEARHLNGDNADNRLVNLKWGTHSENINDKRRHGTNHEVNKTHCPRGHELHESNIAPWRLRANRKRICLSCCRAGDYVRYHPEAERNFQEISDQYFAATMRD